MSMNQLINSKNKIKTINTKVPTKVKPRDIEKQQYLTFEEKYKRMTTYVEKPLLDKVENLYKSRIIKRKTDFVNAAFKEYIKNHYQ